MFSQTFMRIAVPAAALGVAVHAAHATVGLGGAAANELVDTWLSSSLSILAAVICLVGALRAEHDRVPLLCLAAGLGSWALGDFLFVNLYRDGTSPVPSVADVFYAGFYPGVAATLLIATRRHLSNLRLWLDGLVAALTLCALLIAVGFGPVVSSADAGSAAVATTFGYTLADLVLIGLLVAVFTMAGFRLGLRGWLLGAGLVLAAVADWTFSYEVAHGTYEIGTLLDTAWPAAMLLLAFSAWASPRPQEARTRTFGSFALAAMFIFAAVALLVVDHYERLPESAIWLAASTFVLRTVRTLLAFSDKSRALRSAQVSAALVESIDIAIFRTSREGIVQSWNPGAVATFGHDAGWAVGRPVTDLVAGDSAPVVQDLVARAATADAAGVEITAATERGELAIRLSPLRDDDDRVTALTVIARDVTQRLQVERADRANKAKSEFLSRMSHELRTPLNAVLGFGQLLSMRELEDEARDEVDHILKAGDHLLELINETLEISHIESGRLALTIEPVDPAAVVSEVVGLMAPLSAARRITVDVDADSLAQCVAADRQRLKQVLLNLLSNAIKFNRYGGRVCVRGAALPVGRLAVAVSDTGFGIAAADLPRLFSPFERLGRDGEEIEGSGLGLALSLGLMEAMDGTIDAVSAPDAGSTFTLELPQAAAVADEPHERPLRDIPVTQRQGRRSVICIEDNEQNRELVEQIFATIDDVDLTCAEDGAAGIAAALAAPPDLVLLDLNLPDMHGHEILDRLRADERTRATPVIVVSADATPAQIDATLARGAFDYVTKPIDIPRLLELLDAALAAAPVQH